MTDARDNFRGILLMIMAMAGFALEDMFVKIAASTLPTGEIMLFLGVFGAAVFWLFARYQGTPAWSPRVWHPAVICRNLGEMVGSFGFITALALTPLTTSTAIFQAAPLAITLGAAVFLGEKVGWRRWSAICIGFIGVLIIIRPGLDGFRIASLWSVVAVIGTTVRDLATRRIPADITTGQISAWGFVAVAILGAMMLASTGGGRIPSAEQSLYLFGALVFGISSYWAIIQAMRLGEVAVVTPFRYTRLIFAMTIGILIFKERPDTLTLVGAAIIIGSGLLYFRA